MKIKAVLFDLDGTLLDTAADLNAAINAVLKRQKKKPLRLEQVRPIAGQGSKGLIKLGLKMQEDHPDFLVLRAAFFDYYEKNMFTHTQFFAGIETVLQFLKKNHIPWGIVTNKIQRFTRCLVQHFPLLQQAQFVISGDSLTQRKPRPEPLLKACTLLEMAPEDCLYVGDAIEDAQAAYAANIPFITALYGYSEDKQAALVWPAYKAIDKPLDLLEILTQRI
jgi:2-phosphoglycolate phosphatase